MYVKIKTGKSLQFLSYTYKSASGDDLPANSTSTFQTVMKTSAEMKFLAFIFREKCRQLKIMTSYFAIRDLSGKIRMILSHAMLTSMHSSLLPIDMNKLIDAEVH